MLEFRNQPYSQHARLSAMKQSWSSTVKTDSLSLSMATIQLFCCCGIPRRSTWTEYTTLCSLELRYSVKVQEYGSTLCTPFSCTMATRFELRLSSVQILLHVTKMRDSSLEGCSEQYAR